ncbi:MAG: hypothetical protein ABSF45_15730 [Terriglobia bacterium]|jgi:hypothetical protein
MQGHAVACSYHHFSRPVGERSGCNQEAWNPTRIYVHVTFLLNFLDELRRKIPAGR